MKQTTITRDNNPAKTPQGATKKRNLTPRKTLSTRVNSSAYERLKELSERDSMNQWEMLNRIIQNGIPQVYVVATSQYKSLNNSMVASKRYRWNERLLKDKATDKRYKGSKGSYQLKHKIYITAWNDLECLSNEIKHSKARIVQTLIDKYKPMSKEAREKANEYRRLQNEYNNEYKYVPKELTEEEKTQYQEAIKKYFGG